jgi:hypothetical protein
MSSDDLARRVLQHASELDADLAGQREFVMAALRRHQFRHKWVFRTLSTFFWTSAAAAYLLAGLTRNETLLVSTIVWLLLGTLTLLQSRLRRVELKIDEVLAVLEDRKSQRPSDTSSRGEAAPSAQPRDAGR